MTKTDFWKNNVVGWLNNEASDSDVVLASRVQLARNLRQYPFSGRADNGQLMAVNQAVAALLPLVEKVIAQPLLTLNLAKLTKIKRDILTERKLVTPKFLASTQGRELYITDDTSLSILVNEEDHFKVQCLAAGFDLETPLQQAMQIDDVLESQLDVAFDEKLGYLTACPTNLGTGLKVAVLLHLPGLTLTDNVDNIINFASQLGITIQPAFAGENEGAGSLFQFASQSTLGYSEEEIIANLQGAVAETIEHERRARKALSLYMKDRLEDNVWRAYGTLANARLLNQKEAFELLSRVKLGIDLKLINEINPDCYAQILFGVGNSFLQNLVENENLSPDEIERLRAQYIRRILQEQRTIAEDSK